VARSIKEIVSRVIIFELADPRMGFVTVTEVDVSPDMTQGTVKLSIMGDEKHGQRCLEAIRHAAGHIQGVVNKELGIKIVPRLRFVIDESIKKSSRLIERAVSEYQQSEEPAKESTGETDQASAEDEGDAADVEDAPDDEDEENVE
jgi:ribosome-binding factor A